MSTVSTLWSCQRCSFDNKPTDHQCQMCFNARNTSEAQTKTKAWQCKGCKAYNSRAYNSRAYNNSTGVGMQCAYCNSSLFSNSEGNQSVKDPSVSNVSATCASRRRRVRLDELFGAPLVRFLVVVFTHGDSLKGGEGGEGEEAALRRMLESSPEKLKELVNRVNNRYIILDNTASQSAKEVKVKALLRMVGDLVKVNGGQGYSTRLLDAAEQCMHRRERQLEESSSGLSVARREGEGSGGIHFMFRDLTRGEVTRGSSPLLQELKGRLRPLLAPMLQYLAQLLVRKLVDTAWDQGKGCALM
ncbi:hypothetical protein ACOMHN_023760 [Nucella lapillus]